MDFQIGLPILGFERSSHVTLSDLGNGFYRLRDVQADSGMEFTLIDPAAVRNDYIFDIDDQKARKLRLNDIKDIKTLAIMIVGTPIENSFINFLAPLVFNTKDKIMGQVVLENQKYPDFGIAEPIKKYIGEDKS